MFPIAELLDPEKEVLSITTFIDSTNYDVRVFEVGKNVKKCLSEALSGRLPSLIFVLPVDGGQRVRSLFALTIQLCDEGAEKII